MGIEDLKDSSSIGADADQVIILYREKTKATEGAQSSFKPETLVRVDASRYHPGGETLLHFDGARGIFTEIYKER
jgi:replicative DNA helicase